MMNATKSIKAQTLANLFQRGYYRPQRLHIFERGGRNGVSGIRATIFGATGFMGPFIGSVIGYLGSDVIFPHKHDAPYDDECKELKLCANLGQSFLVKHMDFHNPKMIDRVIANSNVVINLIGPRKRVKRREEFDFINIEISKRIAQAVKRNPGVLRYIQFSAAGAAPDSPSPDLATKWIAEQEVLNIVPSATILRPTTVFGRDDYFVTNMTTQKEFWYHFVMVPDDCMAKRQPIYVHDVALATLNALKLDETCGKIYELGGPHVYSYKDCYEIVHNILRKPTNLVHVPKDVLLKVARVMKNWDYFSMDWIIKHGLDIVVDPKARKIDELFVQPISFAQASEKLLQDLKAQELTQDSWHT